MKRALLRPHPAWVDVLDASYVDTPRHTEWAKTVLDACDRVFVRGSSTAFLAVERREGPSLLFREGQFGGATLDEAVATMGEAGAARPLSTRPRLTRGSVRRLSRWET